MGEQIKGQYSASSAVKDKQGLSGRTEGEQQSLMLIILSVLLCVDKGQLKEWISLISSQVCHLPEHLLTLCPGTIIREAAHL